MVNAHQDTGMALSMREKLINKTHFTDASAHISEREHPNIEAMCDASDYKNNGIKVQYLYNNMPVQSLKLGLTNQD